MDHTNQSQASAPDQINSVWSKESGVVMQAIEKGLVGSVRHVAILSEYLSGRETLIEEIAAAHSGRIARITLDSFPDDHAFFETVPDAKIILLENCQYLFRRRINGFHLIYRFIRILTKSRAIWVTSWNIHAWEYLDAVLHIGRVFPVQVFLGNLSASRLQEYILSVHTAPIFYTIDTPIPKRLFILHDSKDLSIPFFGGTISIPYRINWHLLARCIRREKFYDDPAKVIFDRLAQISRGNPWIARSIWEMSQDGMEIRLSALTPPSLNRITDPDAAYLLSQILTLEKPTLSTLYSALPEGFLVDPILYRLSDQGFISIADGRVSIRPLALAQVTSEMQRLRMVW